VDLALKRWLILAAIQTGQLLRIRYAGCQRVVEPHAFGKLPNGREFVRAWQVASNLQSASGWKLFAMAEFLIFRSCEERNSSAATETSNGASE
jgi:hypothetical protein